MRGSTTGGTPAGSSPRGPTSTRQIVAAARRLLRRHRRVVASALAAIAVLLLVPVLRPPQPPTVPVVVAAQDLPAGTTLTAPDVRVRDLPASATPPGAFREPTDVQGRTVSGPLLEGEPLTATRVVGDDLLASGGVGPAEGLVGAPVRIADSDSVTLLRPGDLVDVVAASDAGLEQAQARVVARRARVLTVPRRAASGSGGLLSGGGAATSTVRGTLVVLAVSPATAVSLAGAEANGRLSVVLLPASGR